MFLRDRGEGARALTFASWFEGGLSGGDRARLSSLAGKSIYNQSGINGICLATARPMRIQINGEARDVSPAITLAGLLEQLGMNGERVAIELNRNLVPRQQWAATNLSEQDRLEIVHFVGGGNSF
jgi:thiamine biosynthesis protein ThiS